jgi:glycosyltransferase involved in cell wall biosynthesis
MSDKVVLLISGLMYGGGQRVVIDLADALQRSKLNFRLVLLGRRIQEFDRFKPAVVEFDGKYNRWSTLIGTALRLHRELRRQGPVILHTHGWDSDVIGWLASAGLPIRRIIHLHVTPDWITSTRLKHRLRRTLTQLALASAEKVIAVSDAVRMHWSAHFRICEQSFLTIHNGVDVLHFMPSAAKDQVNWVPVIGVAARLAPMKGIEYLLDALEIMSKRGIALRCRIAGKGELLASLKKRCLVRGIAHQVEWMGHVADMRSFYESIDCYVLPSVSTEGLPLGILEAMASGLPTVATSVAGAPEALRDGIDGILVPPRDPEALANALARLIADSDSRARMGRAARERAERFFPTRLFAEQVLEQYMSINLESPKFI